MKLFKLSTMLSVAGFAAFASFVTHAGIDIKVKGKITPGSCDVGVTDGANLDWGSMNWVALKKNEFTTLSTKRVSIVINCPEGTAVKTAIRIIDSDSASALVGTNVGSRIGHGDASRIFGIGIDPGTRKKIGNFVLNPVKTIVDTKTNETNFAYGNVSNSGSLSSIEKMEAWSYSRQQEWSPAESGKPAEGNSFTWIFDVEPQINAAENISSSTEVSWSGAAQVNVRYF